jgi:uncharacterized damage-inducible protein DinB
MKELLQQFSAYHLWATTSLFQPVFKLTAEQLHTEVASSFGTIHKTILHLWDAESIWWQRVKLEEQPVAPSTSFRGTTAEAAEGLLKGAAQWDTWLKAVQEYQLQHQFIYRNTKKEQFKQPVYKVLLHIFNHGTYHRGQMVNMLRQLGVDKVPATDFIVWSRK